MFPPCPVLVYFKAQSEVWGLTLRHGLQMLRTCFLVYILPQRTLKVISDLFLPFLWDSRQLCGVIRTKDLKITRSFLVQSTPCHSRVLLALWHKHPEILCWTPLQIASSLLFCSPTYKHIPCSLAFPYFLFIASLIFWDFSSASPLEILGIFLHQHILDVMWNYTIVQLQIQ